VGQVLDPARDPQPLGLAQRRLAEEDAGDPTGDHQAGAAEVGHARHGTRSFRNSSSPMTFTPSSLAFFSLDPASSPATTRSVFRETLPDTLPPRRSISALASSRDSFTREPVSTTLLPKSG